MIKETLLDAIIDIWPMIVIFSVIISSFRISFLIINKEKFVFYKEIYFLFFIIYILLLFHIVTFQDNNFGTHNFTLFNEITRYDLFSKLFFKNIIGNVLLFLPFGLFLGSFLKKKVFFAIFVLSIISSLSIEIVQYSIGRTFDIDDIFLNVIGGILGYYLFRILNKIKSKLPKFLRHDITLNFFILLILIIIVLYFTNWYIYILDWVKT